MTAPAPWSVKGIDPKAREIAKDLARRAGMTLGEWLNQMIQEGPEMASAALRRPATASVHKLHTPSLSAPSAVSDSNPEARVEPDHVIEALDALRRDQARMADKLRRIEQQSAGPRSAEAMSGLESALNRVAGHLDEGEARTRETIDSLRQDMDALAQRLNEGITDAAHRHADAMDRVEADMSRVAGAVEQRLKRTDGAQAEALERLGAEIARIVERLAERIAGAERRSARAVDDVSEQMGRVAERLDQRQERISTDLLDRMRQCEERIAWLTDETRGRIDPQPAAAEPAPSAPKAEANPPLVIYGVPLSPESDPVEEVSAEADPRGADDFDMAQAFPQGESGLDTADGLGLPSEWETARARNASIREMLAAARAATLEASETPEDPAPQAISGTAPLSRRDRKKKEASAFRSALLTSGIVAALGMTATYVLSQADVIASWSKGAPQTKTTSAAPAAAAKTAPQPVLASAPTVAPSAAPEATRGAGLFSQAKDKITAKDPAGLDLLLKAANLGYAPAEFYLARLYELGAAGLKVDVVEARRWTERAAYNGDVKAMHNLAMYYFGGEGGAKNLPAAAEWFRRAANLGLIDSQYNLAQLYEEGFGVKMDPAEAYKWFLIAAHGGDQESKAAADRLKSQLPADQQQTAERAAQTFSAKHASSSLAEAPASTVSKTQ